MSAGSCPLCCTTCCAWLSDLSTGLKSKDNQRSGPGHSSELDRTTEQSPAHVHQHHAAASSMRIHRLELSAIPCNKLQIHANFATLPLPRCTKRLRERPATATEKLVEDVLGRGSSTTRGKREAAVLRKQTTVNNITHILDWLGSVTVVESPCDCSSLACCAACAAG